MRGMTDIFWTILVIIVAALLALLQLYKKNNIIFALVVVWAFLGIIIKRVQVDPIYAQSIIRTTGICIALITAAIGLGIGRLGAQWYLIRSFNDIVKRPILK